MICLGIDKSMKIKNLITIINYFLANCLKAFIIVNTFITYLVVIVNITVI
jgi:hypothetical protein